MKKKKKTKVPTNLNYLAATAVAVLDEVNSFRLNDYDGDASFSTLEHQCLASIKHQYRVTESASTLLSDCLCLCLSVCVVSASTHQPKLNCSLCFGGQPLAAAAAAAAIATAHFTVSPLLAAQFALERIFFEDRPLHDGHLVHHHHHYCHL